MNRPDLTVSNFMENSIGLQKDNENKKKVYLKPHVSKIIKWSN